MNTPSAPVKLPRRSTGNSAFKRRFRHYHNILSFSGGKDSTAQYIQGLHWDVPFRAVFADTGNEHEITLEYVATLHLKTGGPQVEVIKADFTRQIEGKRKFIAENWENGGVPADRVRTALDILKPTGNPMLDLCMWKGRFPSSQRRFCTEQLKTLPMMTQILLPAIKKYGTVISWQGVRKEESKRRALLGPFDHCDSGAIIYRPLLNWKFTQVFEKHDEAGIAPNPLYKMGFSRVGCMPCIMENKMGLRNLGLRFPEHVARLREWEQIVADVSKRGISTFFAEGTAPYPPGYDPEVEGYYGIDKVIEWSNTDHGGKQFGLGLEEVPMCQSKYGLCE